MTCHHPLTAYRLTGLRTEKGKSKIVFSQREADRHPHERIDVACGRCLGCRIDRSKEWAIRCVHEAVMYDDNCFITLTFNEDNMAHFEEKCCPANEDAELELRNSCRVYQEKGVVCDGRSLCIKDFQLFMKRLRKVKRGVRYYHCGEYGSELQRPHHHACLFNCDFEDKVLWTERDGVRLYRSAELESLWPYGFSSVGDVTYESAAYCARYITKKMNGEKAKSHYRGVDVSTGEVKTILPEFTSMSRRPGLGARWFAEHPGDVYPKGFLTIGGKKLKSPKYYDDIYDRKEPEKFEAVRQERRRAAKEYEERGEKYGDRLRAKEKVLMAKLGRLPRRLEHEE